MNTRNTLHTMFRQGMFAYDMEKEAQNQIFPVQPFLFRDLEPAEELRIRDNAFTRATGKTALKAVPGLTRSVSRIIGGLLLERCRGFGGWGIQDGEVYVDWFDDRARAFNARITGFADEADFTGSKRILIRCGKDGQLSGCAVDEYGGAYPYVIRMNARESGNTHTASAALTAIMLRLAYTCGTDEMRKEVSGYLDAIVHHCDARNEDSDPEEWLYAERALENIVYGLFSRSDDFRRIGWDFDAGMYGNPQCIAFMGTDEFRNADVKEFHGDSPYIGKKTAVSSARRKSIETLGELVNEGTYFLDPGRILTPEEEALVPRLDDMVPGAEVLTKAALIKGSSSSPRPFRNVLWTGETGTGKSTAAMMMAQLFRLPYRFMTIDPDTMVSDLYENILPDAGGQKPKDIGRITEALELSLIDPEGAWRCLTGEEKTGVSMEDVVREALAGHSGTGFISVRSPLVETFEKGGVCEIQEVNLAAKPGVMAGINAALDDIGIIRLPSGELIRRHPDAVVICTANVAYEGTRALNKAVKSRMTLKGVFELPDDDTLVRRVADNSGLSDRLMIRKMLKAMHAVREILEKAGETNGVCSVREVQAWAQAEAILNDPFRSAMSTIVPSASDDPEVVQEVIACLQGFFAPKEA